MPLRLGPRIKKSDIFSRILSQSSSAQLKIFWRNGAIFVPKMEIFQKPAGSPRLPLPTKARSVLISKKLRIWSRRSFFGVHDFNSSAWHDICMLCVTTFISITQYNQSSRSSIMTIKPLCSLFSTTTRVPLPTQHVMHVMRTTFISIM